MPQADDTLREKMFQRFGDHVDEAGPMQFLQDAGYTLSRDWTWSKPGVTRTEEMTEGEYECLIFLVNEWDFGGLEGETNA